MNNYSSLFNSLYNILVCMHVFISFHKYLVCYMDKIIRHYEKKNDTIINRKDSIKSFSNLEKNSVGR